MARRLPSVVVELGRASLRAVEVAGGGRTIEIRRTLDIGSPAELGSDDPASLGAWIAAAMDSAGFPRSAVILALPREVLVARRLLLPTADRDELPEMARLAMRRELPVDGGDAAIDFLELERVDQSPADQGAARGEDQIASTSLAPSTTTTTVFAVAVLRRTLDPLARALAAAGREPTVVGARLLGTAALARAALAESRRANPEPAGSAQRDGHAGGSGSQERASGRPGLLVVDIAGDGVELLVLSDRGEVVFSRGAPLRPGGSGGNDGPAEPLTDKPRTASSTERRPLAEAVLAEARRSWLGYRMGASGDGSPASVEVRALCVLGEPDIRDLVRPGLRELTGLSSEVEIEPADGAARLLRGVQSPGACGPLAALLLASCPTLNLLRPRQAPDKAARRRQTALVAAGVLVLAGLLGYTFGRREAAAIADRREDIARKAQGALAEGWRLRRNEDKLSHVAQWARPNEDWLGDLVHIREILPQPGDVVIDKVDASQEFSGVKWERPRPPAAGSSGGASASPTSPVNGVDARPAAGRSGDPRWTSSTDVRIVLEGEAKTRAIADALREQLIADSRFNTTTSGSDTRGGERLPYPFGFLLRAQRVDVAPLRQTP